MKFSATLLSLALLLSHAQGQTMKTRRPQAATQEAKTAQPPKPTLPIRRLVLYSNGVAYFERRGQITGNAEIQLPFKQSQVDDVLKSMVVLDLGKGRIGAVSYNSSAPSSARLNDIPFSIESGTKNSGSDSEGMDSGLAGVLRQLQGARVAVSAANQTTTGAILTVEERKSQIDANKPPVITHYLVIASENGELSKFNLEEVRAIKLLDEGARHDIKEFADASASARRRDAKTITVTSDGAGEREMRVSYTVAAPIWKTTYRIVLDATGKPFFQGWAIVDNVGDEDWSEVALSLVSGSPVSFIQPIQQPLYRYRPVVTLPEDLQITPQVYEAEGRVPGGVPGGVVGGVAGGMGSGDTAGAMSKPPPPPPSQRAQNQQMAINSQSAMNAQNFRTPFAATEPSTSVSDLITREDSGVTAAATGSQVGDLFEYRIDQPVTVRRDRSALIPILQTKMEGERVSIYDESTRRDRPMSGIRLKNTSPLTLEGGSLTVLEGDAYAGETLMERLKPGEFRFISFALDLGTLVTTNEKADRQPTFLVRILNGVFQAHYYQTQKKTYTITNQTDKPRIVYVQYPLRQDWTLSDDTQKPTGKTQSFYSFRVEVAPRATVELPVTERQTLMDSYAVSDLTPQNMEFFIARKYIDDATRAALEIIIEIKGKIAAINSRVSAVESEVEEISTDQERLRKNIEVLKDTPETKQLLARYVTKAGQQETRLEQIETEKRAALNDVAKLQKDLYAAIRALHLNRQLEAK